MLLLFALGIFSSVLDQLPRPAKTAEECLLDMTDHHHRRINLFQVGKCTGWWPFHYEECDETRTLTVCNYLLIKASELTLICGVSQKASHFKTEITLEKLGQKAQFRYF